MPEVIVVDLQHVIIDGINVGGLVSTCCNHVDLAADIEAAVQEWLTVFAAQSAKEATDKGEETANKLRADFEAASAKIDELNAKLVELHAAYTNDVNALTTDCNEKLATLQNQASQQIQSLTAGNQTLSQELHQARQQIVSSFDLAKQAMTGSSESARAAAQEWHRVDTAAMEAVVAAKKAATSQKVG